jgi:hypothetical protein
LQKPVNAGRGIVIHFVFKGLKQRLKLPWGNMPAIIVAGRGRASRRAGVAVNAGVISYLAVSAGWDHSIGIQDHGDAAQGTIAGAVLAVIGNVEQSFRVTHDKKEMGG